MNKNATRLPRAATANTVVQQLRDETLVYNLTTDQAFCLNETSAKVFNRCDGATTFDQLKAEYNFSDDLIHLALDELKAKDLIEDYESKFAGVSRREVIKKVGLASLVALPAISALIAPTAAHAASIRACVNTTGPLRAPNTFLGYRSPEFCANDAFTCCSNSTRYDTSSCIEINNVTHQMGCTCYCN